MQKVIYEDTCGTNMEYKNIQLSMQDDDNKEDVSKNDQ